MIEIDHGRKCLAVENLITLQETVKIRESWNKKEEWNTGTRRII